MTSTVLALLPLGAVVLFTIALLVYDLFADADALFWTLSACVFGIAFYSFQVTLPIPPEFRALNGLMYVDGFSALFGSIVLMGTALTSLLHHRQAAAQNAVVSSDVEVLLLLAACGGLVMVSTANLIVFFLGFELLSVCVYVLTGIAKREQASAEGALKYFILGAYSSAFLLYGITLVYGATGSMDLALIAKAASGDNLMLLVGIGLIIFGFCFKIGAVPFHFWAPDVYQGAPVSIAAYMAVVVKAAAFGSFLRVMSLAFGEVSEVWVGFIWTVSVLTMTVGNLMAIRQRSIKRMLAYSSISHAGYALMGFLALGPARGADAVAFYMIAYTFMTVASFGAVLAVTGGSSAQYDRDELESFAGIGWTHPALALIMSIAMLSLGGMPPFGGFMGKFYLFSAAIQSGYVGLAIIAALNSVLSLYYYLRVLVVMYFTGDRKLSWSPPKEIAAGPGMALALATFGTVYLGIFSDSCIKLVHIALKAFS